jgi:hypothetical protein
LPGACPALARRLPGARRLPLPIWEVDIVDMLQGCFIDGKNDLISEKEVVEALGIWATNGVKVNTKLLHY